MFRTVVDQDPPIYLMELNTVDSTNSEAKRHISSMKDQKGLWIVEARSQTEGYGRKGHRWESTSDQNYYGTFCFAYPKGLPPGVFTLWLGYELQKALARHCDGVFFVKWPNDLCVLDRGQVFKVGGILTEVVSGVALCGVGVNLGDSPGIEQDEALGVLASGTLRLSYDLGVQEIRRTFMEHIAFESADLETLKPFMACIADQMRKVAHDVHWVYHEKNKNPTTVSIVGIDADTGALVIRGEDVLDHKKVVHGSLYALTKTST